MLACVRLCVTSTVLGHLNLNFAFSLPASDAHDHVSSKSVQSTPQPSSSGAGAQQTMPTAAPAQQERLKCFDSTEKLTTRQITQVARHLNRTKYTSLGAELGLDFEDIAAVEGADRNNSDQLRAIDVIKRWKDGAGSGTVGELAKALASDEVGLRNVAAKVFEPET